MFTLEYRQRDIDAIDRMAANGVSGMYEKICIKPNGESVWVSARTSAYSQSLGHRVSHSNIF